MMQKKGLYLLILTAFLLLFSCMKEDHLGIGRGDLPVKSHEGLFITCEGNFTYNNASLSYYDIAHKEVYNEVFFTVNGLSLGDVAQSVVLRDSLLYVVVNNSGKIIVLDADDFSFKKKITGFTSPRYIHFLSREKAYVTDLYAHAIAIVDLEEDTISGYISVHNTLSAFNQHPTEQMVAIGNRVFVNCWSYDRKILVIDSDRDKVIDSVAVAKQPNSMVLDKYNRLWVLSDGGYPGSPYGQEHPALTCIEPYSLSIIDTIMMDMADAPSELAINGTRDTLFFLNGDLYYMAVVGMDAPEIFVESPYEQSYMGGFYGLGVDPATSEVYVADAIDYNQPGVVYRYSPHAMPLDTFQVGIIPGAFCFKEKMLPSNSTIQRR